MSRVDGSDERVVVLAPSAHDGPVTAGILAQAGIEPVLVRDGAELCDAVEAGAAAVLIAEEALVPDAVRRLTELLGRQEPWSDLPVILFTSRGGASAGRLSTIESIAPFGNVALLDRPVGIITLVSAVRAALRARRRQYATRSVLAEQRRIEEALRQSETRFRTVIEHSRDGINMLDLATGQYVFMSPAQVALTGFTAEELSGMTASAAYERVHPEDRELSIRQQRAIAEGKEPERTVEYRWMVKSGEYRWFSDSRKLVRNERGEPVALVGVSRDITDQKRAEEERLRAEEAVREADRRKTEFLAVLSHELRNPLAPIRNAAVILERAPPGSEAAARALEVLQRQTEQLSRLVDDLLDISRITHGKIEVQLRHLDARELVQRAFADAKPLFDRRGVRLTFEAPEAPLWVNADAARLSQIVGNLLNNALKFTPPGGSVHVEVTRGDDTCVIGVRDTGQGIDPMDLDRIFDPFWQAERTRRGQGGLGLGLALVRQLAARHGGSARAESEGLGKGARFVVQLPLASAPAQAPELRREAGATGALSVLIVEDNEDAAATLGEILSMAGSRVSTVATGRAGVFAAAAERPDVIICDIGLPDMSGHDVIRAIRATGSGRRVFAVALTGYAQPEDREAALAAGFDAHLPKPPQMEDLEQLLSEAARRRASFPAEGFR